VLSGPAPSNEEIVDLLLDSRKRHLARLLEQIKEECKHDPIFLDRVLKTLRPLRERGRATPPWQEPLVTGIVESLKSYKPHEIVETIAKAANVSESHARRLYDAALKRRG
jgi:hypothetical protein